MHTRARTLALALTLAAGLWACGDDGNSGPDNGSDTGADATADTLDADTVADTASDTGDEADTPSGCQGDGDCAADPSAPRCMVDTGRCVECLDAADCVGDPDEPVCQSNHVCGPVPPDTCVSPFDCPFDAAACDFPDQTSGLGECVPYAACADDDAAEHGDDGPAGATVVVLAGGTATLSGHVICSAPDFKEADWFRVTVADGDQLSVTVSSPSSGADLDLLLLDSQARTIAESWWQQDESLTATYLPAGDYFVVVRLLADSPASTAIAYVLDVAVSSGRCASVADCAAEYDTQRFRGACNTSTGACAFLEPTEPQPVGQPCDSDDDCLSARCGYGQVAPTGTNERVAVLYVANADQRGICTATCTTDATCNGDVCTEQFAEGDGDFCAPPCVTRDDCPILPYTAPAAGAWTHLSCDASTGRCGALTPSIAASDQTADPADHVVVARAVSDGPGWAVVHADDGSGNPGTVLGESALASGTQQDIDVALGRPATDGETLHAVLHEDSGSIGVFEEGVDVPVVDGTGAPLAVSFTVTVPAPWLPSVTVSNQTLAELSTTVVVAEAVSTGPGWLAIHDDNAGAIGVVIGHAPLSPGATTNLRVVLDRPAVDGEKLYAMLHVDAGTLGTWEPATTDLPVLEGGVPLAPSFIASVPNGTPAVRIRIGNGTTFSDYQFSAVEPAAYETAVLGGAAPRLDPSLNLRAGWRYAVVNPVASTHPLELIVVGTPAPANDVVLLSQGATQGSAETDGTVSWTDAAGTVAFTVSTSLAGALDGYRCGVHASTMRGAVLIQ